MCEQGQICGNCVLKPVKHTAWTKRYSRVPVFFRDPVQAPKHNRKDLVNVLLDEAENVFIIPEVQSSFCNLPEQWQDTADMKKSNQ